MEKRHQEVKGILPYPPSINKYWITRIVKKSQTIGINKQVTRSKEALLYARTVFYSIRGQNLQPIIDEWLRLELYVFPPDNKKRDLDNLCKAVLDSLQYAGLYPDDYRINELFIKREKIVKNGRIEFILRGLGC